MSGPRFGGSNGRPLPPAYAQDLRRILAENLDSVPSVPAPTGSIKERVRAWAARRDLPPDALESGRVRYAPGRRGVRSPASEPPIRRVSARDYARLLVGHCYSLWQVMTWIETVEVTAGFRDQLARIAARECADRYDELLLSERLARAIAAAAGGDRFFHALESCRGRILGADTPEAASEGHARCRADLLVLGARGTLSDRQTSTAELFTDLLLLQHAALQDQERAEAMRGSGETRYAALLRLDCAADLEWDRAVTRVLRTSGVMDSVPAEAADEVSSFLRRRARYDRVGVLSLDEVPPEPEVREEETADAPECAPVPRRSPSLPRTPPEPVQHPPVAAAPLEWSDDEDDLVIPEWEPLGLRRLHPRDAGRHVLIVGETGSGKTRSAVAPLLRAALRHPNRPCLLVIDPKRELAEVVAETTDRETLSRRVIAAGQGRAARFDVFEGVDPLSASAHELAERILSLSRYHTRERQDSRQPFFGQAVESIITQLLTVDLATYAAGGSDRVAAFWNAVGGEVVKRLGIDISYDAANYIGMLRRLVQIAGRDRDALRAYVDVCRQFDVPSSMTIAISALTTLAEDTWTSIVATATNTLLTLGSDALAQRLSLNPFERAEPERIVSVRHAMDQGWVVVYQPSGESDVATTAGRAVKTLFAKYTFMRTDRHRGFVLVADEFQRWISDDEADWLSMARAFRGIGVFATQSVSSLALALARTGTARESDAALEVLLANTATKLVFRSTDPETRARLRALIPDPPVAGMPHLMDVRPPATLATGETVFVAPDGRCGRRQIRLVD